MSRGCKISKTVNDGPSISRQHNKCLTDVLNIVRIVLWAMFDSKQRKRFLQHELLLNRIDCLTNAWSVSIYFSWFSVTQKVPKNPLCWSNTYILPPLPDNKCWAEKTHFFKQPTSGRNWRPVDMCEAEQDVVWQIQLPESSLGHWALPWLKSTQYRVFSVKLDTPLLLAFSFAQ